jgi:hypothetical protein
MPAKLPKFLVQRIFIHHPRTLSKSTELSGIGSIYVLKRKALFGP